MALARSASGPGGLSINTSSANSLFGSGGTTPATGGMFGSTQAAQPAAGGGLFGSATPKTSAPAAGGLFGSTAAAPATGGLFGSTPAASSAGGLSGATTATSQPSTGGGLFGAAKPATGGLFGGAASTAQPASGGLFGAAAPAQAQSSGGLFGQTAQQGQPQNTGGGLFVQSTQQQAKPATSLFGGAAQEKQNPLFAGSTQAQNSNQQQTQPFGLLGSTLGSLGQSNQQQTVPGVRVDITNLRGTSKYSDLHDELQKEITNIDNIIQGQIQLKNDCDAIMPSHKQSLESVGPDIEFCTRKMNGVLDALAADAQAVHAVQGLHRTDEEAARLSFKVVDNLKLPAQYHSTGYWSGKATNDNARGDDGNGEGAQDLVSFFSSTADELATTLARYQKNISEIEAHLRGVEAHSVQQLSAMVAKRNGSNAADENPIQELADTLTAFEQSIFGVAAKVGESRVGVQTLQQGDFLGNTSMRPNGKRGGVY
ncbi:nucleoporin NUP49/NSP49 [Phlyctema vagabunda]|uniref:Nucleoporin NUP49/NSP49 n=1 Tax=Phlyctema vagabunda TaxID=108571 RepID=A0ABR4P585_9HELO